MTQARTLVVEKQRTGSPHVLVDARFGQRLLGGDRCRFELATKLAESGGGDYTFLVYDHAEKVFADARTLLAPWRPEQHPWSDLFEHVQLPVHSRRIKADIYHGTFNVLPVVKPAPISIVTVHDMAVFAFPDAYGKRFVVYMRQLIKEAIRRADKIITVSECTKNEILRYVPGVEHKIQPILNGVGSEFLTAARLNDSELSQIRDKYEIKDRYVLFVGNLERKKNLRNLIEAFCVAVRDYSLPHKLVVVGKPLNEGPDAGLTGMKLPLEHVRFTGYVPDDDLPALYRAADLIAYPSLYEGFGMPVLEGMAVGVPVLTSNVSSLPEVAGDAAMLVAPHDVRDIAAGLNRALTDGAWRGEAVERGLARASYLSWEKNASETAALYDELWHSQSQK